MGEGIMLESVTRCQASSTSPQNSGWARSFFNRQLARLQGTSRGQMLGGPLLLLTDESKLWRQSTGFTNPVSTYYTHYDSSLLPVLKYMGSTTRSFVGLGLRTGFASELNSSKHSISHLDPVIGETFGHNRLRS